MVDTTVKVNEMQKRILEFLEVNGPSLPIHIAKETSISQLFAGAYLSELVSRGQIKISKMKVGNSPLYFLEGQEAQLEKFMGYLAGKEREACLLLKKHGILADESQLPAIRVALRSLKDFAVPFQQRGKIFWRYITYEGAAPKQEEKAEIKPDPQPPQPLPPSQPSQPPPPPSSATISAQELKEKAEEVITKGLATEVQKRIESEPRNEEEENIIEKLGKKVKGIGLKERFLQEVKGHLTKNGVELLKIEKNDRKQISGIVKVKDENYILIAFNKKRFDESDLLKVYRKFQNSPLPFYFLSKGEISKKTKETISACKRLGGVGVFGE